MTSKEEKKESQPQGLGHIRQKYKQSNTKTKYKKPNRNQIKN